MHFLQDGQQTPQKQQKQQKQTNHVPTDFSYISRYFHPDNKSQFFRTA
jgi:hypothetical protein